MKIKILVMMLVCSTCWAFQAEDRTGTVFHNQPVYIPQYVGQKDRYDEALLRNDPEVLVSTPKKIVKEDIVVAENQVAKAEPKPGIEVTYDWDINRKDKITYYHCGDHFVCQDGDLK
jgi:hypothetical protein